MAVTQLFYHVGPKSQLSQVKIWKIELLEKKTIFLPCKTCTNIKLTYFQVAKALVRLLRGPREVQYVVLLNIATMCERNPVEGSLAISKVRELNFKRSKCLGMRHRRILNRICLLMKLEFGYGTQSHRLFLETLKFREKKVSNIFLFLNI